MPFMKCLWCPFEGHVSNASAGMRCECGGPLRDAKYDPARLPAPLQPLPDFGFDGPEDIALDNFEKIEREVVGWRRPKG